MCWDVSFSYRIWIGFWFGWFELCDFVQFVVDRSIQFCAMTVYKADEDGYVRVAANWIYDDSLCPGRPYIWRRHRFRDANIVASQRNDLRCSLVFGLPGPRRHDLARRSFPTSTLCWCGSSLNYDFLSNAKDASFINTVASRNEKS